jgi:hypothetical protein
MPRLVTPLTQLQIKNAKPREKPYKLADGGGLYLEVTPAGGKHWRMKYRQPNGKENKLHFGPSLPCPSPMHARSAIARSSCWPPTRIRHVHLPSRLARQGWKHRIRSSTWPATGTRR